MRNSVKMVAVSPEITILLASAPIFCAVSLTKRQRSKKIKKSLPQCGPVAQLGARFHGMEEVVGSIPTRSTIKPNNLANRQEKRDTL
jgi:hypothetical protein